MCGICAYIGKDGKAITSALAGIGSLDHRGDDSLGIAFPSNGDIVRYVVSKESKPRIAVNDLKRLVKESEASVNLAIAHTRWATFGAATDRNAHPHYDKTRSVYIVHNGNVDNLSQIKKRIEPWNSYSETDSEVIANLIADFYQKERDMVKAMQKTLCLLEGSNAIVLICRDEPGKLFATKRGSTLIFGKNGASVVVASDQSAFGPLGVKEQYRLKHNEVAVISAENWEIFKEEDPEYVDENYCAPPSKDGFDHYMLKEITEQDWRFAGSLRGRFDREHGVSRLGGMEKIDARKLRKVKTFHFVGCGTAYNAGLYATMLFNRFGIAARAWVASEFCDCHPVFDAQDTFVFISQSGETHDTMEAAREITIKGNTRLGIINVPDSMIWNAMDAGISIRAGLEKAVASTKAFTLQNCALILLAVFLARQRNMTIDTGKKIYGELMELPEKISSVLSQRPYIKELAKKYAKFKNAYFLGRYFNYITAVEGSLKLKEISGIHSEAYPLGEMKHGPLALIGPDFLSVVIVPNDTVFKKSLVNIQEIKGRQGPLLALTDEDSGIELADDVLRVPKTFDFLSPVLYSIPIQLLSYYIALELGKNPDKPDNISKVVTVG